MWNRFSLLSSSIRTPTSLFSPPTWSTHLSSTIPIRRSFTSSSSSSSSSSSPLLAVLSAMVFIPSFYYITKPPHLYNNHRSHPLNSSSNSSFHTSSSSTPDVAITNSSSQLNPDQDSINLSTSIPDSSTPNSFKYVLIGGGTATYSALVGIREIDPTGEVLIITAEDAAPYQRPPLTKELWFSQDPDVSNSLTFMNWEGKPTSLFYQDESTYDKLIDSNTILPTGSGTKLLTNTHAIDLNPDNQTITVSTGATIHYDKVLLATGGTPRKLNSQLTLPEPAQRRVVTYRTLDDYRRLNKVAQQGKRIAVIGGGFLGSELSVALARKTKVTQIIPEGGNMALVFPKYLTKWTTQQVKAEGVEVLTHSKVSGLKYDDNTDQIIVEINEKPHHFDHVVVSIGIEPNVILAKKAGLEIDPIRGGIMVNAELKARHNIYCAGDNVSFHDITFGRRRVEHYDNSVLQGKWAGRSMAGHPKAYSHQSMFWSDLGPNIGYEAIGIIDSSLVTVGVWNHDEAHTALSSSLSLLTSDSTTTTTSPTTSMINTMNNNNNKLNNDEVKDIITLQQQQSQPPIGLPLGSQEFRKGVVFYVRNDKIVGILMFNIHGQTNIARKILLEGHRPSEANILATKFKLY